MYVIAVCTCVNIYLGLARSQALEKINAHVCALRAVHHRSTKESTDRYAVVFFPKIFTFFKFIHRAIGPFRTALQNSITLTNKQHSLRVRRRINTAGCATFGGKTYEDICT